MAELSNNPFIDHNSSVSSRYPNIATSPQPTANPQYAPQWQQQQQPQQSLYPQSNPSFLGAQPTGYPQAQQQWPQQTGFQQPQQPYSPGGFQPSSSFGQQLVGQVNNLATGYPQQQQQQQAQYTGYPQQQGYGNNANGGGFAPQQTGYGQQQQPYAGNGYLAQFDPYSQLSQLQNTPTSPTASSFSAGNAPSSYQEHPRAFIQSHKAELEAWDAVTWKQALNAFENLKIAWEARKRVAETRVQALGGTPGASTGGGFFGGGQQGGYGGYGAGYGGYQAQQQQELERVNMIYKEAVGHIDTIAASSLQMSEVFTGYRHSGDLASKRRVRESCNAALQGLPDYPPQTL
ncbi:hypothetical protein BV25DRAFT_1819808 [Artomyces pyxidatus]|uniref:Uncharacterized protein n=1 Tax=Artomyces pyxidatus TaxID=48021 RepID=A0ACB8TGF4_9AGAM|nr:hypothetical protein BV25DRAFT_1819808 [Artomyces pyxidatus]